MPPEASGQSLQTNENCYLCTRFKVLPIYPLDNQELADHKEKVIDLLARVTRVSVETMEITEAMKALPRVPGQHRMAHTATKDPS